MIPNHYINWFWNKSKNKRAIREIQIIEDMQDMIKQIKDRLKPYRGRIKTTTYEAETKEYLQAKKLPTDEGTYPEELMTQITIKAFDELTDRLYKCEAKLEDLKDISNQIHKESTPIGTLDDPKNYAVSAFDIGMLGDVLQTLRG